MSARPTVTNGPALPEDGLVPETGMAQAGAADVPDGPVPVGPGPPGVGAVLRRPPVALDGPAPEGAGPPEAGAVPGAGAPLGGRASESTSPTRPPTRTKSRSPRQNG